MKLHLNDQIEVIAGKDKGKKGKIIKVNVKKNKIVVEKINIRTKHIKKTKEKRGEIIHYEAPIDVSNAMIICPACGKKSRVGYKKLENNKKQRICKNCKESVETQDKGKK
ncbi:MAG: 50S ribosomal protein L24 [Candidatus Gracilibacteria bacterium]|jgi:large subunit ribosomal protein L24